MDGGDVTSYSAAGHEYEYLEKIVRVLSSENSELHLKLFFQKDVERQQGATIDALRQEVAELKETVKDLQERKELAEFVYVEEKCKRQDLEEEISFVNGQQDGMQSLKNESADLSEKIRCQLELETELRGTIQELEKRVGHLEEGIALVTTEKELLQRDYFEQTEKVTAYDRKIEVLKAGYAEKLAAGKSVFKRTLNKVRIELDSVADELEKKVAEYLRLQGVATLKPCSRAQRDTGNTFEGNSTCPDHVSGVVFQEKEDDPVRGVRYAKKDKRAMFSKTLPMDADQGIRQPLLHELHDVGEGDF